MKFGKTLGSAVSSLMNLKFVVRDAKLGTADLAVLQVALMIAALDGQVRKDEVEAFMALAKKCRGANAKSIKAAYEKALRVAGYIAILVQVADEEAVLSAFADEVIELMPDSFLTDDPAEIRRAFVLWTAMAMSDGDYSGIERAAIQVLLKRFSVIHLTVARAALERDLALSPAFRMAYGRMEERKLKSIRLLPNGFLEKVEAELAKTKDIDVEALIKG